MSARARNGETSLRAAPAQAPALAPAAALTLALALALALAAGCTRASDEPARDAGSAGSGPGPTRSSPTGDSPTTDGTTGADPSPSAATAPRTAADRLLARVAAQGPELPRDPRTAARQIAVAERAALDPATPPRRLAAAGHLQQVAYTTLARHPAWDAAVRRRTPPALHPVIAANVAAHREFRSMHPVDPTDLAEELPPWRIVRPAPARELLRAYRAAERRYGVDWAVLAAVNLTETRFGRIEGDSIAGARGPMQFLPSTWELYGEGGDIRDPRDTIPAAARLLAANGYARDREAALRRYNDSAAYVRGVLHLAGVMQRRPRAFHGYHQWQVHYLTARGRVWLPEGYDEARPVPLDAYLARNPRALLH